MILSQAQVDRLLWGLPVQSRVLVKEGEIGIFNIHDGKFRVEANGRIKWQVGRDYAVQFGGEKWVTISAKVSDEEFLRKLKEDTPSGVNSGLWYCPKCNESPCSCNIYRGGKWKPLRFKLSSLRMEHLLDISNKDAKKEGYTCKHQFLRYWLAKNNREWRKNIGKTKEILFGWNPKVLVREGGLKKE